MDAKKKREETISKINSENKNLRIKLSIIVLLILAVLNLCLLYLLNNIQNNIDTVVKKNQCFMKMNNTEDKYLICYINGGQRIW